VAAPLSTSIESPCARRPLLNCIASVRLSMAIFAVFPAVQNNQTDVEQPLYDDLELQRLVVQVERDRVVLTIHPKRGRQQSKVVVGEDPT
jgi:type II secretory pathway component PulJ